VSRLKSRVKIRDSRKKSKLEVGIASGQWKTKAAMKMTARQRTRIH